MISFSVLGLPVPQGSKNPWGGEASKRLKPWRNDMMVAARRAMDERRQVLLLEPVDVHLQFCFPRPRAHFGTGRNAGKLKESAPVYVAKAPDLDKLIRAVGDALTHSGILHDDGQIAILVATKVYDRPHGVKVIVSDV